MEIQLQVGSLVHIMVQYIIGALCASGHRGLCRLPSGIWLVASVTYATMSHCISGTAIVRTGVDKSIFNVPQMNFHQIVFMARGEGRNKKKKDLNAENLKDASCQKLVLLNLFSESPIVVRSRCFQTDTSLKMVLVDETSC